MPYVLQWIDLIWLPLILLVLQKEQRLVGAGFFISCAIMMRLQIELMETTGYVNGLLPFMTSHVGARAVATYSLFYAGFLMLAVFSCQTIATIMMAACISIFFVALTTSMIVMVL